MPLVGLRCCHRPRIDMVVTSHYAALPWGRLALCRPPASTRRRGSMSHEVASRVRLAGTRISSRCYRR